MAADVSRSGGREVSKFGGVSAEDLVMRAFAADSYEQRSAVLRLAQAFSYRRVPRWRRWACKLLGHRWAFVVGKRPSGGDRHSCGRCGALEEVGW